jgi:hypothetical protein
MPALGFDPTPEDVGSLTALASRYAEVAAGPIDGVHACPAGCPQVALTLPPSSIGGLVTGSWPSPSTTRADSVAL